MLRHEPMVNLAGMILVVRSIRRPQLPSLDVIPISLHSKTACIMPRKGYLQCIASFFYLFIFSLSACGQSTDPSVDNVVRTDTIIIGENIMTMESALTPVSGLAVRGEEIVAVGEADGVLLYRGNRIRVGKQADLVKLDANPLQVDLEELQDIQVVETFS